MTDDITRELAQLQQYAATLQGLLAEAQAGSPQRSQAEDGTGAVAIVLDESGQPEQINVASDWRRRVEPEALGSAVADAFTQAAEARMAAWGRALEGGEWGDKVGRMMRTDSIGTEPAGPADVPQLFRRDQAPVTPRPIGELTEDMIKAFDNVDAYAGASSLSEEFPGTNGAGTVSVRLSRAGLAGCTIDARWAADQSGATLTGALGDALASARAKLRTAGASPQAAGRLDALFDEAMALLNDPRRLAES